MKYRLAGASYRMIAEKLTEDRANAYADANGVSVERAMKKIPPVSKRTAWDDVTAEMEDLRRETEVQRADLMALENARRVGSPRPKKHSSGSPIHPWRYSYLWVYRGAIREGCHMPRHPDTVAVGVPMGAHLLRRLDAVASDLGMDRPEAFHKALHCSWYTSGNELAARDRQRRQRLPRLRVLSTGSAAPSPTWSTPCRTCRPAAWADDGCSPGKVRRSTPPRPPALSSGHVASSVTGLYPWLGYTVSDRVSVWGVTGYGTGALALTPGEAPALTSGLSMGMAAGGMRGDLADSVVAGFGLAFKADALWVGTAIDGVEGPGGNLAATEAAATRVRTGLEASRGYRFERGLSLTPSVEVGLRHDGGDAERGAGLAVGAGLVVSDTSTGLAVDVRVRMLLVHQADGFSERGLSLAVSYDPTPSTPLGFTARVEPSWGGQAQSGAAALWGRQTMAGMAPGGVASGNRLDGEVGYGLPVGGRLVGTPRVGIGAS